MASNEADIDDLVRRSFDALPEIYRDACRGLGIRTELQASYKVMAALDVADPYERLGLYHGINLTQKSVFDLPSLVEVCILYRTRPA